MTSSPSAPLRTIGVKIVQKDPSGDVGNMPA